MQRKSAPNKEKRPSFIEAARRAQLIEAAAETLATLGYARASLGQIALRAGISKRLITYYFSSKEELFEQVVQSLLTAAATFMRPQIAAEPTVTGKLRAYLGSNVAYIAAHRPQIMAISEIVLNLRAQDGSPQYRPGREQPDLEALMALLRSGQDAGEFRAFDLPTMALAIRGAVDAVGRFLVAHPDLDGEPFAQELATLFDQATRKD